MAQGAYALDLDSSRPGYRQGEGGAAEYPKDGDEETKFAAYSKALLEEQRGSVEPLWITWTQNLLYLAGLQWWTWDWHVHSFMPPRGPRWKEHPVRNLLVAYFKNFMAKVTKNRTAMTAIPASTSPEDLQSGQLADDVLKAKYDELHFWKILRRAIAWAIPTGNAWIMPYWNTQSGKLMPLTTLVQGMAMDEETGAPAIDEMTGAPKIELMECPCDDEGNPILDERGAYDLQAKPAFVDIGEIGYRVFSPFQVFMDANAENEDEATFVLIVEPMPVREVYRRWPEVVGQVVPEDVSDFERFDDFITGVSAGADTHTTGGRVRLDYEIPKSLVLHYYEKPCPEYPEGRHWVTTGNTALEQAGPLPDGVWPVVVPLGDIDVPGQLHRESSMTAAVGLQREYNEVCAQIKEHHNLMLRGKWLVPQGSNIRRGQITNEPGEVIQHTPGMMPVMADLKPLPQQVYEERSRILEDFQLITGIRDVSMGNPPPGVTAGKAFLILQEADDSDFGPFLEAMDHAVAQLGWLTLQIIQRYYDEERLIYIAQPNNRYRVRSFKGADLSGVSDVRPQAGSSWPWNKVAMQSMLLETATAFPQLFTDPETGQFDHERFRELLPIGGMDSLSAGADLDLSEAHREEDEFENWDGLLPLPVPQPWQNAQVHRRAHAAVLKADAFKRWPPLNQEAFLAHFMDTELQLQLLMQQQIAMQAALTPGAKGNDASGATDAPAAGPPE